MVKGASSVLIRKNSKRAKVIDPQDIPWRKRIKLVHTPEVRPRSSCGPQNIISGILNPRNYIDVKGVEWGEFYYLRGRLVSRSGEVFPLSGQPLKGGGEVEYL